MKKIDLITIAEDTLRCVKEGGYKKEDKTIIIDNSELDNILYTLLDGNITVHEAYNMGYNTKIKVVNKSTLGAILDFDSAGETCCVLNFASAKYPGGGFRTGSRAQEESLARTSNLYESLITFDEMYKYNKGLKSGLYSDYIGYSGNVSFFKDDRGNYLNKVVLSNVITSPAVNVGVLKKEEKHLIEVTMRNRIDKIFRVAIDNSQTNLVLGAFGSGVFKNNPKDVARIFRDTMVKYKGYFKSIVYAVYDDKSDKPNYTAFKSVIGGYR